MRVLLILTALAIISGCNDQQELTGPWELWVLVSSPTTGDVWNTDSSVGRVIRWAAIPGEAVRCDLIRNGEYVLELFDWRDKASGEFEVTADLSSVGYGEGFQVIVQDDQGFYGVSSVFEIR